MITMLSLVTGTVRSSHVVLWLAVYVGLDDRRFLRRWRLFWLRYRLWLRLWRTRLRWPWSRLRRWSWGWLRSLFRLVLRRLLFWLLFERFRLLFRRWCWSRLTRLFAWTKRERRDQVKIIGGDNFHWSFKKGKRQELISPTLDGCWTRGLGCCWRGAGAGAEAPLLPDCAGWLAGSAPGLPSSVFAS